ncbi:MAG: NUDIX hydrolase [Pseudomonadota bacterium]
MTWLTLGDWTETGDQAAGVLLPDKMGRVCLQLRDDFPDIAGPGQFGFFGGQREPGESLEETAVREIKEETGITLSTDSLRPFARSQSARGTRIYIFETDRLFTPSDICVREGAGFAFLTPTQIDALPCLPVARLICRAWHAAHS